MTRPMPGPPDWYYIEWHPHLGMVWIKNDDECDETFNHAELDKKRLTDAECEREWEAFEQDASTALLLHTLGDKRVPAWRFKRFNHGANTWRRFATRATALEEA